MNSTFGNWSNRELQIINKYRERVQDLQLANLQKKIVQKDTNSLDFYRITPKQELPKYLQKMKFQTLHSKQKDVTKTIKIFKKQNSSPDQVKMRIKLKSSGKILLLSQIYKNLGQNGDFSKKSNHLKQQNFGLDLQEWQKNKNAVFMDKIMILRKKNAHSSPRHKQSRIIQQKLSELQRKNQKGNVNYFKEGSNYKKQIQKQLDIICMTHSNQSNQINKYILIQNSSKLLKKELDQRKIQIEQDIKSKMKILNQTRIQHHNLFQQKTRLILQDRQFYQQVSTKDQFGISLGQNSSYFMTKSDKINDLRLQKKTHIEQNQSKIMRTKKMIDGLENNIVNAEQQLRSIMVGERCYFKSSLKMGMDCRDTGLGWIIKKLGIKQSQLEEYEFPLYLDKKSRQFLILKTNNQEQLEKLLQEKRKFVNQIGRDKQQYQTPNFTKTSQFTGSLNTGDKIIESMQGDSSDIPKKYRMSLRKITILNQQFAQNQSLIQLKQRNSKGFQISSNTDGLTGKKLYQSVTQKIRMFDFSKMKKDKNGVKNKKILQYQNLLNNIKQVHIKLQDLDIQHESHLVNHYKDSRGIFYTQAAACFGYKKAYSMIIKHFSWKNEMEM